MAMKLLKRKLGHILATRSRTYMDAGLCFDEVQTVFLHLLQNRITFGYLKEIILVCDNAKGGSNLRHFLMQLAYCFFIKSRLDVSVIIIQLDELRELICVKKDCRSLQLRH